MAYNGASGKTQAAMAEALELQGMSLQEVNQANQALNVVLENADSDIQILIANSLWVRQGVSLLPDFRENNHYFYKAKVTALDFQNPESANIINNWIKETTGSKIEQIVHKIDTNQILLLINALYFKGKWSYPFKKRRTVDLPFYLSNGTQKKHPMMTQSGEYSYYENSSFQAINLPYGQKWMSFYVVLPRENITLSTFEQQLTPENWQQWMQEFRSREGSIVLPRFKIGYEIKLNNALKSLGMEVAFDDRADFSRMTAEDVFIDQVKHKTFVEVNEEGTKALVSVLQGESDNSLSPTATKEV